MSRNINISNYSEIEELLNQLKKESAFNELMVRDVTGAPSLTNEPDTLFYTMFSREDAQAFYSIYDKYTKCFKDDPFNALNVLKVGLREQCQAMSQRKVCPVEILLFTSRLIKDELNNQDGARHIIINVLLDYLDGAQKSIEYILDGWEWPFIFSLVIEACGIANNSDLIALVMNRASGLIRKYSNAQDHLIVDSLINMLCFSQNSEYTHYYGDIFSEPHACTLDAEEYLINKIHNDDYLRTCSYQVIDEICSRDIPDDFRKNLEYAQGGKKRDLPKLYTADDIYALAFGSQSKASLDQLQYCRDKSLAPYICDTIVKHFMEIKDSQRARAILLLSAKGSDKSVRSVCAKSVVPFLCDIPNRIPGLDVPAAIALFEYGKIEASDVFKTAGTCNDPDLWLKAVGFHLKNVNHQLLQPHLFTYVQNVLGSSCPEQEVAGALNAMYLLCRAYDNMYHLLHNQSMSRTIVESMLYTVELALSESRSDHSYSLILDIISLLMKTNADSSEKLLSLLDEMKSAYNFSPILAERVDKIIRKVDHARPPEGN